MFTVTKLWIICSIPQTCFHYYKVPLYFSDPNSAVPDRQQNTDKDSEVESKAAPFWDTYDPINQLYLELGNTVS
jgi:hypothetical protein